MWLNKIPSSDDRLLGFQELFFSNMLVSNVNQKFDQAKNSKQGHLQIVTFCEAITIQMTFPTIVLLTLSLFISSMVEQLSAVDKYALVLHVKGFPFGILAHNKKNVTSSPMREKHHKPSYIRMEETQYLGKAFDVSFERANRRRVKVWHRLQNLIHNAQYIGHPGCNIG
jgi:hypothetical protein